MLTWVGNKVRIHHNNCWVGNVLICKSERPGVTQEMEVPVEDLLEFVSLLVRNERIAALEQATAEKILGVLE